MAWPFDAGLLNALRGSHEMLVSIDVFDTDGIRAENVKGVAGTINATLLSDVCRTGTLTVPRPLIDAGLFDPRSDKVRIRTGVVGWPPVTIFVGRVQSHTSSDTGQVAVPVADFGDDVVEARFDRPWAAQNGGSVIGEMERMLRDVDTLFSLYAEPGVQDGSNPPGLAWNDNRAQALDELAGAINAIWRPGRTGNFSLIPNPYNLSVPPTPVLTLSDGDGGTLAGFEEVVSREGVYNSITLEVQRTGGGPPMRTIARDMDPSSPTYWGGKFGKRNRRLSVQTPYTATEARRVASRILRQSLALARSWRFSTPHFPLLDPGDVIAVKYRNSIYAHVIETISYPLAAIDQTTFSSRELRQFNDDAEDLTTTGIGGVQT